MIKILNYPKTIEESKDLIDMLVARYNERITQQSTPKLSTPYEDSKEFLTPPKGLNGGSEFESFEDGGVRFGKIENIGVPYEDSKEFLTPPKGLNGGSEFESFEDGGVRFGKIENIGVPYEHGR